LNIIVCIKQTLDTEGSIRIDDGFIVEDGNLVVNPYDEYALEEGMRIKEASGGTVTVISIGSAKVESALRTAYAFGVDEAIHVLDNDVEKDEHVIAYILASVIRNRQYDLILCGNVDVDSGAGQVAIRLAEQLGLPHVASITNLVLQSDHAVVERDVEGEKEHIEVKLPALFTSQQGLNDPRYPSLPNIMKAKKKPIEVIEMSNIDQIPNAKTQRLSVALPERKKTCVILQGDLHMQVQEVIQTLSHGKLV
jgi:electron transfer flavoprotein beta subunit